MDLQLQSFGEINLADPFFDSLKAAYPEFSVWYNKKAVAGEQAYVFFLNDGRVADFLYMKIETEEVNDVVPVLPAKRRLKVGTFKIMPRHTRRGERFMKKIMDRAMAEDVDEVYVTIFPTPGLEYLIQLFEVFGFYHKADKPHEGRESEWVMVKDMRAVEGDIMMDYPRIMLEGSRKWLLSIAPQYHTELFPDSILTNENYDIVQDCTQTNGIYKTYICWMQGTRQLKKGDLVLIYRTNDGLGSAKYRSVATSVCTVWEVKTRTEFKDLDEFLQYTQYSVFTENERREWYAKNQDLIVIKMLYNVAFTKRVIRKDLIEQAGLPNKEGFYWGFFELTHEQLKKIVELGKADERYIID